MAAGVIKILCPAGNNSGKKKSLGHIEIFFQAMLQAKRFNENWQLFQKKISEIQSSSTAAQSEARYGKIHLSMLKQSQTPSYHVWNFIKVKEVLEEPQSFPAKLGESHSSKQVSPVSNTAQYLSNSDNTTKKTYIKFAS